MINWLFERIRETVRPNGDTATSVLPEDQQKMINYHQDDIDQIPFGFKSQKLWMFNDGSILPVDTEHAWTADDAGVNIHDLLDSGAVRMEIGRNRYVAIEAHLELTEDQIKKIKNLVFKYGVTEFVMDDAFGGKVKSFEADIESIGHLDYMLRYGKIEEANIRDLKRKQRTISWLFPTFQDRVNKIGDMGGLRLVNVDDDNWDFKVHSGTKKDTWYDCVIHFVDIKGVLKTLVMDRRLWTVNKEKVDLRKLAAEFAEKANVQTFCSCPADLYYGGHYIRGLPRYDAKYTNPEHRPPKKRNPRQYGAYCKHQSAIMKALPFYTTAIAKWLNQFYGKEIAEYQELSRREFGTAKAGAKELTKRKEAGEDKPVERPRRPERRPERPLSGVRRGKTHLEDEESIEATEEPKDTLRRVWGSFNK